jgi:outer membrane receptor protein involved in Fe transport
VLLLLHEAHYNAGNATVASLGDLESNIPAYDPLDDRVDLYGITGRYQFSFATLTADASYYSRDLDFNFTFPGLGIPFTSPTVYGNALVEQPQKTKADTYEMRLNAPDANAAWQWTVGGYLQNRDNTAQSVLPYVGGNGVPDPSLPEFQNRTILGTLDQRAVYAETSYRLFDKLTATAGGRWANFSTSTSTAYAINTGGSPGTNTFVTQSFSASKFIKRLNLSYEVTTNVMAYTTYSEGFRAGGANQAILNEPVPAGYGPDTVQNYEAGLKSQWFDKRMTLNVDYYHMIWNDIQVSGATPDGLFDYTTNAGRAGVDGVEFEMYGRPVSGLQLGVTYGFTDARLTASEPFVPGTTESGFAGDPIPAVPKQAANVSVDYTKPLSDGLASRLHADYQYVGQSQNLFSQYLANPTSGLLTTTPDKFFYNQPAYSVVNARLGLEAARWKASVFANNLFDRRGVTDIFADVFRPNGYTYYIMPRVVGLTLSVSF